MNDLPGPLFRTWDEAMAHMAEHPEDLGRPWFIADPDAPRWHPGDTPPEWPPGWIDFGYTDEGAAYDPDSGEIRPLGPPPRLPDRAKLGPGQLYHQQPRGFTPPTRD